MKPDPVLPTSIGIYLLLVRVTRVVLGCVGVGLGFVLVVGGKSRFAGPALAIAREVPGAQYTWGVTAWCCGLIILLGSARKLWRMIETGQLLLGVWCMFYSILILAAALKDPRAGLTGGVVYAGVAFISLAQSQALRLGRLAA